MPENVVLVNDFTKGSVARRLLFHLVSTKPISLIWKMSYKTIYKFGHSVRLAILWGIYPYVKLKFRMLIILSEPGEISLKKCKKQVGLKWSGMLRKVLSTPFSEKPTKPKTTSDSHFGFGFFGVEPPPPPKMTVTFDDTPGRKVAVLGHFF